MMESRRLQELLDQVFRGDIQQLPIMFLCYSPVEEEENNFRFGCETLPAIRRALLLIESGANPNLANPQGETFLHLLAAYYPLLIPTLLDCNRVNLKIRDN